jgi:hypothetical protein
MKEPPGTGRGERIQQASRILSLILLTALTGLLLAALLSRLLATLSGLLTWLLLATAALLAAAALLATLAATALVLLAGLLFVRIHSLTPCGHPASHQQSPGTLGSAADKGLVPSIGHLSHRRAPANAMPAFTRGVSETSACRMG